MWTFLPAQNRTFLRAFQNPIFPLSKQMFWHKLTKVMGRRRSQAVKATVCKTVIPGFESQRRLHSCPPFDDSIPRNHRLTRQRTVRNSFSEKDLRHIVARQLYGFSVPARPHPPQNPNRFGMNQCFPAKCNIFNFFAQKHLTFCLKIVRIQMYRY